MITRRAHDIAALEKRLDTALTDYQIMCSIKPSDLLAKIEELTGCSDIGKLRAEPKLWPDLIAKLKFLAGKVPERIEYAREEPLRAFDETLDVVRRYGTRIGTMVFAGKLCCPALKERPGVESKVPSLELVPHSESTLSAALNQAVQFVRKKGKGVPTDCPPALARALVGSAHKLPEIEIRGIAQTPVLVGDAIRLSLGFDPELQMWINAPRLLLPEVLDKAAARAALKRLKENWLSEFAFVSDLDLSVGLAGMLTAAMRASLPFAPAFLVSKPSNGAGGSTLCELWHIVLTGRRASVINASRDSDELTKQIDGVQLAGRAAIFIDNIPDGAEVRSIAIAHSLSQPSRELRPLGRSTMIDVPCTQMVMFNGVNPRLAADLARRSLYCGLDPNIENPEERVYRRPNIFGDAQRERVSLLTDCFTIVGAYLRCGDRVQGQPLSGYTDWARHVQEPLIWLGECDPVLSRKKIVAEDPVKATLVRLFRAWHTLHNGSPVTAAALLAQTDSGLVDETGSDEGRSERESACNELQQVADEVARDKAGKLSAKTLAYYLRGKQGRIAHGLRLESYGETRDGATTYRVVPVNPPADGATSPVDAPKTETEAAALEPGKPDATEAKSNGEDRREWDDVPVSPDEAHAAFKHLGADDALASSLVQKGFRTFGQIANAAPNELSTKAFISSALQARARKALEASP